ncbi:Putative ribonuclease H protein At1g65750 [Linum perenne]
MGGIGLRSAWDLNKAFIMKIVWGLINHPTDLWARILISKYLKQVEGGYALARKSGFSAIWRGIMKVWPHVTNGMHWSIKDGRNTRFWTDRWVDSGVLLIDHALNIKGVDASLTVSNTVTSNGSWNSYYLFSVLPHDIALQVIGMSPPDVNLGRDSLVWGLEANGMFSKTSQLGREAPGLARQTQLIAWRPGDVGLSTLNTDGSRIHGSGSMAIGGLIRDDRGKFVCAFCGNIGNCSTTRAEIKAIVEGLKLVWDVGIRRNHVQSDSRAAISILQKEDAASHQHTTLVAEFIALRRRSWEISISHVFREANCGADYLANLVILTVSVCIIFLFRILPCLTGLGMT